MKGDIGQSADDDSAPLIYCVRLLSASFLLTGEKNGKHGRVDTGLTRCLVLWTSDSWPRVTLLGWALFCTDGWRREEMRGQVGYVLFL